MKAVIPPKDRTCERCGRHDTWDERKMAWTIVEDDDEKQVGDPFCLHEWDINGNYNPFEE